MAERLTEILRRELQDPEFAKLYGAERAKSEFAVALAQTRLRAGLTQKDLAEKLNRSQPYIAKLEGGDANPTLGTVGSLLAVMGYQLAMESKPLLQRTDTTFQVAGATGPFQFGQSVALAREAHRGFVFMASPTGSAVGGSPIWSPIYGGAQEVGGLVAVAG